MMPWWGWLITGVVSGLAIGFGGFAWWLSKAARL
jgi:hypothetical protein